MFNLEKFLAETQAEQLKHDRFLVSATRKNERMLKKAIRRKLVFLDQLDFSRKPTVGKPELIEVAYGFDQETTFNPTTHQTLGYIVIPKIQESPVPTVWASAAVPHW